MPAIQPSISNTTSPGLPGPGKPTAQRAGTFDQTLERIAASQAQAEPPQAESAPVGPDATVAAQVDQPATPDGCPDQQPPAEVEDRQKQPSSGSSHADSNQAGSLLPLPDPLLPMNPVEGLPASDVELTQAGTPPVAPTVQPLVSQPIQGDASPVTDSPAADVSSPGITRSGLADSPDGGATTSTHSPQPPVSSQPAPTEDRGDSPAEHASQTKTDKGQTHPGNPGEGDSQSLPDFGKALEEASPMRTAPATTADPKAPIHSAGGVSSAVQPLHQPADSASTVGQPIAQAGELRFVEQNHPNIVTAVRSELLPNGGTMRIRLDPPDLGTMQIVVQMREGVINASFQTSSDEATRLLSHSLHQLKEALVSQGVAVEKLQVQQAPKESLTSSGEENPGNHPQDESARQEQQRRQMLQRMWRRLAGNADPLDVIG